MSVSTSAIELDQIKAANASGLTPVEIPGRGHALTVDSGWREVADTALNFVRRFA
jgi:non-heme chloroperoxidase